MTEKDEKAHLLTEAERLLREGASETDVRRAWVLVDLHREWRMTRLGAAKRTGAAKGNRNAVNDAEREARVRL